jgi:hypothetical protein
MNHLKVVGCAALLSGLALIGQAAGADNALLKAPLMACPSDKTVIGGVNACGKIWKIGSGEVALDADGKLIVDIRGLVLNDPSVGKYDGSPDGVDAVAVAVCVGGEERNRCGPDRAGGSQPEWRCSDRYHGLGPGGLRRPHRSDSRALRGKDWRLACCHQQVGLEAGARHPWACPSTDSRRRGPSRSGHKHPFGIVKGAIEKSNPGLISVDQNNLASFH